jgi:hypothetical protein
MTVIVRELLPPDKGLDLPPAVRKALLDMGAACNDAALAINAAFDLHVRYLTAQSTHDAYREAPALRSRVTDDLVGATGTFHAQAVIVLARAATTYATYASRVAYEVTAGRTPPGPEPIRLLPSDLACALDMYLPPLQFHSGGTPTVIDEQNAIIANSRRILVDVVTHQIDEQRHVFDDLTSVVTEPASDSLVVGYPDALYDYAASLVWALAVFTGVNAEAAEHPDEA